MTNEDTQEAPDNASEEVPADGAPEEQAPTADAGESRRAILHTLADVESQLQGAYNSRRQIADAAHGMRGTVHQEIEQLERAGTGNPDAEERYRQLLLDRRHCDVVGALNQEEGQ